jgi:RNA polymerase sigma factor (sigma-70 family)
MTENSNERGRSISSDEWGRLYLQHFRLFRLVASRVLKVDADNPLVWDAIQEGTMRVLAYPRVVDDPRKYFIVSVLRAAIHIDTKQRRELIVDPSEIVLYEKAGTLETESTILADEEAKALHRAISGLPPRQRQVIMGFLNETSYDELSEQTGIPTGSIGPTQKRAREVIKKRMEGYGWGRNRSTPR